LHEDAQEVFNRAAKRYQSYEQLRADASKQIAQQRNELTDKENNLNKREIELMRRATELDKRELYVNDKYQTLEKITRHYETKRRPNSKK
jgi:hypothetical protein